MKPSSHFAMLSRALVGTTLLAFSYMVWANMEAGRAAYARWDFATAVREFEAAAAKGDKEAMVLLGDMAAGGLGSEKSESRAFTWYLKAAEEGLVRAQREVAERYSSGSGAPKSDERSLYWTRIAADRGDAKAQYVLGARMIDAVGVKRDLREAVLWMGRSAEQGYAPAFVVMGDLQVRAAESGQGIGVSERRIDAAKWYVLASMRGVKEADEKFARLKVRMTDDELKEAERRTRAATIDATGKAKP